MSAPYRCTVCSEPCRDLVCARCERRPWADPKVEQWLFELGLSAEPEVTHAA